MTTVNCTGVSGRQYQFEVFPVGTLFNSVPGVYIACRLPSAGWYQALYVGETQSVKDRLNGSANNHYGLRCAAHNGMSHIAVMVVYSDAERLRIETDLRHGLNPCCNRQSVKTNPWECPVRC